jgi:CarD family transcriptional regulator
MSRGPISVAAPSGRTVYWQRFCGDPVVAAHHPGLMSVNPCAHPLRLSTALEEVPMMFKIGDRAVYPGQGVTEITGIESKQISGNTEVLYMLNVLNTNRKIMIPVSKVHSVGLRKVIGNMEVDRIYRMLKDRSMQVSHQTWNRRYRAYVEKLNNGSIFDIAEVLRDLSLLKSTKPLSFGERKMLDQARTLLVKELSVARSTEEGDIAQELDAIFTVADAEAIAD